MDMIGAHSLLFWIGAVGGVASILLILPLKDVKHVKTQEEIEKPKGVNVHSWGVIVFSYILVPMAVNRFGEVQILVASRIVSAILTVLFSTANSFPLAIGLVVVFRVVLMFSMPIRQSFATGIVDPSEIATAIGVSNSVRMGLRTVAPTLAGYMFENMSLTMPFLTGAVLLIANGLLFRVFFKSKYE